MNLKLAKMLAEMVGEGMIFRESKLFHHRGIKTLIDGPDDVDADDWKVRNHPKRGGYDGTIRGFHHLSEGRYYESCRVPGIEDDVHFGFYFPDDGVAAEFCMEWVILGGKAIPRLKVYDGSWHALYHFQDVLEVMAIVDGKDISPQTFCKILIELGLKDLTKREVRMPPSR